MYENFVHKKIEQNEEVSKYFILSQTTILIVFFLLQVIDDFISKAKVISIDLFWKVYDQASVHARYILITCFAKLQIAFIQYMDSRNDLNRNIQNPFVNFGANLRSIGGSLPQVEQLVEPESKGEPHREANEPNGDETLLNATKADSMIVTEDEEVPEAKKPGRKAKRVKRRDISSNVRVTRSRALKSESRSTSDVEMS